MGDIKTYNIGSIENAQVVDQSLDYQALTKQIGEKQEFVESLQATGKTDRALKVGAKLEQQQQFKENVLRLYETFTKIEINATYLSDVAMTLINLSIFYLQAKLHKEKSVAMAMEV